MKNKEHYAKEILKILREREEIVGVAVVNGKPERCAGTPCSGCDFCYEDSCGQALKKWMEKDYSEKEHEEQKIQPEVKNLKKDDRVLVSANGVDWIKRYFEKYDQKKDVVYAYVDGATSWSEEQGHASWKYAKLPEDEPKSKPEIDWAKVPVDTKIFVKSNNDPAWYCRHFARYEHGKVYAWLLGKTSFTTSEEQPWDCAELAEDKE